MLLAHQQNMAEPRNRFGTLMSEATDPANQFAFSANESPRIDFETAAIAAAQEKYYSNLPEHLKKLPRDGHLWYSKKR